MEDSILGNRKILLASGPTYAPIDAVRYITNRSTGRLGSTLAQRLHHAGAEVVFLAGEGSQTPLSLFPRESFPRLQVEGYMTVEELKRALKHHIGLGVDVVFMAAAVLDYIPVEPMEGKQSSAEEEWTVRFRRGEKLIERIRDWSKNVLVVGFKLEKGGSLDELRRKAIDLMDRADAEFVVANRVEEIGDGGHRAYIFERNDDSIPEPLETREAIARHMTERLSIVLNATKQE